MDSLFNKLEKNNIQYMDKNKVVALKSKPKAKKAETISRIMHGQKIIDIKGV